MCTGEKSLTWPQHAMRSSQSPVSAVSLLGEGLSPEKRLLEVRKWNEPPVGDRPALGATQRAGAAPAGAWRSL